jgi:hypothetical protein
MLITYFTMKYPASLSSQLDEVEYICQSWPQKANFDQVVNWILQFDSDDFDLAIRVIRNLNVIGYEDLNNALRVAYSKLMRRAIEKDARISSKNTLFAGIGDAAKSGSMLSYHFRLINEDVSEENFLDDETLPLLEAGKVDNIVLIDDVISTGRQATTEIERLTEKVTPLGVKNIFLLTVCGMREGIQRVEESTKAHTFSAFEYDTNDTVSSLDSSFYEGINYESRESIKKRLNYYGGIATRRESLGYGGVGGLIVFHYNTPNSTLPIIWGNMNSWLPLFKRVHRVSGITSYFNQFDRAVTQKTNLAIQNPPTNSSGNLSLFVEGKSDESVFDHLVKEYDLAGKLGVSKVEVISLGGALHSSRLFETLGEVKSPALFLLDQDSKRFAQSAIEAHKKKVHLLFLEPSIMEFFDLNLLLSSEEVLNALPNSLGLEIKDIKLDTPDSEPEKLKHILDEILHSPRFRMKKQSYLRLLMQNCISITAIDNFINRVKEEMKREIPIPHIPNE